MSGIYIHIPFCKQACHYCDFHFSTSLTYKDELLTGIQKELKIRRNYIAGSVETIYFGGGTPSLLSEFEINKLIDGIYEDFEVAEKVEITLEANPDDLNSQKIRELRSTPINRFSIGVQSFFEEDLLWMNRSHNASQAEFSIKGVQDAGFENITVDLIYGYSLLNDQKWKSNLAKVIDFDIPHISPYSLTVEDKTALAAFIRKGVQKPVDEKQSAEQFEILIDQLKQAGYEHYEISNFAKPGNYSKHNTNYWKGVNYLGIGPSAHSFNGESRQWNIANNNKYISSLLNNIVPFEQEVLTRENKVNEYIMTSLRTMWGADLLHINQILEDDYKKIAAVSVQKFLEKGWIIKQDSIIILTESGKFFADHIASELFI